MIIERSLGKIKAWKILIEASLDKIEVQKILFGASSGKIKARKMIIGACSGNIQRSIGCKERSFGKIEAPTVPIGVLTEKNMKTIISFRYKLSYKH